MIINEQIEQANKAYEALKADPVAWQEELDERAEWEGFDDIPEDK